MAVVTGGGGGGSATVGIVVGASTQIDISGAGDYIPTWTQMFDDTWDFASVPFVMPAGIGLTYSAVDQVFTVLEDGAWWWDLAVIFPPDPDIVLDLEPCFFGALAETTYGPALGTGRLGRTWLHWGSVVKLPAGATPGPTIRVSHAASVSPLNTLSIQGSVQRIG